MHTPIRTVALATERARAAKLGVYPICRAISKMRCRVASLMPPRPCSALSTVPMETCAMSAMRWIPRRCLAMFMLATILRQLSQTAHVKRRDALISGFKRFVYVNVIVKGFLQTHTSSVCPSRQREATRIKVFASQWRCRARIHLILGASSEVGHQKDYGIEGQLGLTVAIEEQGVIRPAFHRPIVAPRVSVGYAPQCHPADHIAMPKKY